MKPRSPTHGHEAEVFNASPHHQYSLAVWKYQRVNRKAADRGRYSTPPSAVQGLYPSAPLSACKGDKGGGAVVGGAEGMTK